MTALFTIQRFDDVIAILGQVADNAEHRHTAMQFVWSTTQERARLHTGGEVVEAEVLIIEGGLSHRLELSSGLICLVEPESTVARAVRRELLAGAAPWHGRLSGPAPTAPEHALELLRTLVPSSQRIQPRVDRRVARALRWLATLESEHRISEATLAGALAEVGLSESRFLHLFTEHVGTPWRRYVVWRRALCAMDLALRGATLTEAAHAAGYTDSAHLSRQFKALFGFPPSVVKRGSKYIQGKPG